MSVFDPDRYYTNGPEIEESEEERAENEYWDEREWDWQQERDLIEEKK